MHAIALTALDEVKNFDRRSTRLLCSAAVFSAWAFLTSGSSGIVFDGGTLSHKNVGPGCQLEDKSSLAVKPLQVFSAAEMYLHCLMDV